MQNFAEPPLPLKQENKTKQNENKTKPNPARLTEKINITIAPSSPQALCSLQLWKSSCFTSGRVKEPYSHLPGGVKKTSPLRLLLSPVPLREGRLPGAGKKSCQLCFEPVFPTKCYWNRAVQKLQDNFFSMGCFFFFYCFHKLVVCCEIKHIAHLHLTISDTTPLK